MSILSTLFGIAAGIAFCAGLNHLIVGLSRRPRDTTHVSFALTSLSAAFLIISTLAIHTAGSLEGYIIAFKFGFGLSALVFTTSLMWFIAFYTGIIPRRFLIAMSLWFAVIILLHYILPTGLLFAEIGGLKSITLLWGEQAVVHQQSLPYPWRPFVLDLFLLILFGFFLYAVYRQFRSGYREQALLLTLTIFFLLFGNIYDSLVDLEVISSIYIVEITSLLIIVTMGVALSREISATESELRRYQNQLELLVNERTVELNRSNQELAQEVEIRKQTELVLGQSEERFRKVFEEGPLGMAFVTPDYRFANVNSALCRMLGYDGAELTGLSFADITHPDDMEKDVGLTRQVFAGEIPYYQIEKRYFKKTQDLLWINLTASVIRDDEGQPLYGLAMIEDITERRKTQQALNRRIDELAALHEIAQAVAQVTELSLTLQAVSEMVTGLFKARYTHVITPKRDGLRLEHLVGFEQGVGPIASTPVDIPLEELPLTRQVLDQGQPLVIPALQKETLPALVREFVLSRDLQSVMLVPLLMRRKVIGLLVIASDQVDREFSPDEIKLAETVASDIAAALENARLFEQEKNAAAAEERNRIARDLHDSVTQSLYSVSLVAEALPRVLERDATEAKRNAQYLRRTTLGALAEMRTLLFELRPHTLIRASLPSLLQQLADILTGRNRIPVEITLEGHPHVPPEVKFALYRIAQESFNNIAKHAQATQVWVTLQGRPDRVILSLRDNGQGFDPLAAPQDRLGLSGMRERAQEIGAELSLDSAPEQGTRVSVTWSGATNGQGTDQNYRKDTP